MQEEYMQDSKGRLVPISLVKEIDIERDRLVKEIYSAAKKLSNNIATFKQNAMGDVLAFVELSAEKYGVKYGGKKGNIQLQSYDGKLRVIRSIGEYITFDERLQVAKQLIDECINEWKSGIRHEVIVLIDSAFQVDKQGKVNTERILSLRRLDIKNDKWVKAMEAISDSITVSDTKMYIRIYERSVDGIENYKQLPLDISSV